MSLQKITSRFLYDDTGQTIIGYRERDRTETIFSFTGTPVSTFMQVGSPFLYSTSTRRIVGVKNPNGTESFFAMGSGTLSNNVSIQPGTPFLYDNTTGRLVGFIDGGIILFMTSFTASSLVGFGDSITVGVDASTAANRWLNIVSTALGAGTPLNKGVSGTVLQNSNDSEGSPRANNGRDRFASALLGANKRDAVLVNYGFNDARYIASPSTFNVVEYKNDLSQVIAGLIEGGYTKEKIAVTTPYYITDVGLNTGSTGFSGQTRAGFVAFVDAAKEVTLDYGCYLYDSYGYMINNGAEALISADDIHPGDFGMSVIAQGFLAACAKNNDNVSLSVSVSRTSSSQASYIITEPSKSVTDYTFEYAIDGTYSYGNAVNVTALSGFITIPAVTSRVRARANFQDGTKSPWSISSALVGVFLNDTFTDVDATIITSHSPETGGSWVVQNGFAPASPSYINSNRVVCATTSGIYYNNSTPNNANYYVEGVIDFLTDLATDNIGIMARSQGSSASTYYFVRWSKAAGSWGLFKRVAGVITAIGVTTADTFLSGSRTVRIDCNGTTISASVDGIQFTSATDSAIATAGFAGIVGGVVQGVGTGRQITSIKAEML